MRFHFSYFLRMKLVCRYSKSSTGFMTLFTILVFGWKRSSGSKLISVQGSLLYMSGTILKLLVLLYCRL